MNIHVTNSTVSNQINNFHRKRARHCANNNIGNTNNPLSVMNHTEKKKEKIRVWECEYHFR